MQQQNETRILSVEKALLLARIQAELRNMEKSGKQQLHDLTRLRIERNRAARHARCTSTLK